MNKISTVILLIFLTSNVFAALEQVEIAQLKKAIDSNNIQKFQDILKKADKPFKSGLLDSSRSAEGDGMDLIRHATKSKECKDEFVQSLLDFGAEPYSDYYLGTSDASEQLCPSTIQKILPFYDDKIQAQFGDSVITSAIARVNKIAATENANEDDADNMQKSVKLFADKAKEKCREYDVKNKWCGVKDSIVNLQKTISKLEKKLETDIKAEKYAKSPEGIKDQICELEAEIKEAREAIQRQNEIAKTSGFLDKSVMHSKGARIVDVKKEISELKYKLKNKTVKCM